MIRNIFGKLAENNKDYKTEQKLHLAGVRCFLP